MLRTIKEEGEMCLTDMSDYLAFFRGENQLATYAADFVEKKIQEYETLPAHLRAIRFLDLMEIQTQSADPRHTEEAVQQIVVVLARDNIPDLQRQKLIYLRSVAHFRLGNLAWAVQQLDLLRREYPGNADAEALEDYIVTSFTRRREFVIPPGVKLAIGALTFIGAVVCINKLQTITREQIKELLIGVKTFASKHIFLAAENGKIGLKARFP